MMAAGAGKENIGRRAAYRSLEVETGLDGSESAGLLTGSGGSKLARSGSKRLAGEGDNPSWWPFGEASTPGGTKIDLARIGLPLGALNVPTDMRDVLREWDTNGDGNITLQELFAAAHGTSKERRESPWQRRAALLAAATAVLFFVAMLGMSVAAIAIMKDMRPSDNGVLSAMNGSPLRVGSMRGEVRIGGALGPSPPSFGGGGGGRRRLTGDPAGWAGDVDTVYRNETRVGSASCGQAATWFRALRNEATSSIVTLPLVFANATLAGSYSTLQCTAREWSESSAPKGYPYIVAHPVDGAANELCVLGRERRKGAGGGREASPLRVLTPLPNACICSGFAQL